MIAYRVVWRGVGGDGVGWSGWGFGVSCMAWHFIVPNMARNPL